MCTVSGYMKNIKEIEQIMFDIKLKRRGKVISNYYNQCLKYQGSLNCWIQDNAVAFEYNDEGVHRIYFFATDKTELKEVISCADNGCVIDFLTKDKQDCEDVFKNAGFTKYMEYGRFYIKPQVQEEKEKIKALEIKKTICKQAEGAENNSANDKLWCGMADEADADEMDAQLREEFDVKEAHFWPLEKLRKNIQNGWVWVVKNNGKIIAANMFEIQGIKSYGAYLYNRGNIDILSLLLQKSERYVGTLGIKYFYCWMKLSNKRIVRYNMKVNGYVPDGLFDIIYVKE